ncbi:MAG: hypothetical protein ACR2QV_08835 [Gammaproteobacteria bacterium]
MIATTRIAGFVGATAVLIVGVLVYLFDRSAADLAFIPSWWVFADGSPGLFGNLGYSLPSFAHTFSFAMVLCVLSSGWRWPAWAVCGSWCAVEASLELAQHQIVSRFVIDYLPAGLVDWPVLQNIPAYFQFGRFDPMDMAGIILGGVAAWLAIAATSEPGVQEKCP